MNATEKGQMIEKMKSAGITALGIAAAVFALLLPAIFLTSCGKNSDANPRIEVKKTTSTTSQGDHTAPAARGKYLVSSMGCHDCHTPWKMGEKGPEPDMSRMLSGHPEHVKMPAPPKLPEGWDGMVAGRTSTAFAGAWGVSFAMNLTPDTVSGLGTWTEDLFLKAIRTGKHWGTSRPIMPPMPWTQIRNLSDDDLKAIYAYLRTVPPVRNNVPAYIPPPQPLADAGSADVQNH